MPAKEKEKKNNKKEKASEGRSTFFPSDQKAAPCQADGSQEVDVKDNVTSLEVARISEGATTTTCAKVDDVKAQMFCMCLCKRETEREHTWPFLWVGLGTHVTNDLDDFLKFNFPI